MTPDEIAESVKRLRKQGLQQVPRWGWATEPYMDTINALVELVAEMSTNIEKLRTHAGATNNLIERKCKMYEICIKSLTKAAPIAALRGE